jgi:hypothetical protein
MRLRRPSRGPHTRAVPGWQAERPIARPKHANPGRWPGAQPARHSIGRAKGRRRARAAEGGAAGASSQGAEQGPTFPRWDGERGPVLFRVATKDRPQGTGRGRSTATARPPRRLSEMRQRPARPPSAYKPRGASVRQPTGRRLSGSQGRKPHYAPGDGRSFTNTYPSYLLGLTGSPPSTAREMPKPRAAAAAAPPIRGPGHAYK